MRTVTIKNLVNNAGLVSADGIMPDDWAIYGDASKLSNFQCANGVAVFTPSAYNVGLRNGLSGYNITVPKGHIIYSRCEVKSGSTVAGMGWFTSNEDNDYTYVHTKVSEYVVVSLYDWGSASIDLLGYMYVNSGAYNPPNFSPIYFTRPIVIDLTACFEGVTPPLEYWCNANIPFTEDTIVLNLEDVYETTNVTIKPNPVKVASNFVLSATVKQTGFRVIE